MKMKDEDSNPKDRDDMHGMKGHGPGSIHKMPHTMPHINDSENMSGMSAGNGASKPVGGVKKANGVHGKY